MIIKHASRVAKLFSAVLLFAGMDSVGGTASGFFRRICRGTLHVVAVPETDTWAMLLVGLGLVACRRRVTR